MPASWPRHIPFQLLPTVLQTHPGRLAGMLRRAACLGLIPGLLAAVEPGPALRPDARRRVTEVCQTCHLSPDPAALPRETWRRHALPYMAPLLGLARPPLEGRPDAEILRAAGVFPDEPALSLEAWRELEDFFVRHAPEALAPAPPPVPLHEGLPGFDVETWSLGEQPAFTTLLHIAPDRRWVWVGDGQDKSLRTVDASGRVLRRVPVPSGPVHLIRDEGRLSLTLIGRVFPSDEPAGQVWSLAEADDPRPEVWLSHLRRPVHATWADLDGDGRGELFVSAFGNHLGSLSRHRRAPDGTWSAEILQPLAGTLQTRAVDWDGDGRTDLLVLRAQAWEGLTVLLNDGAGGFRPETLLAFPPTFGAVAFDLADLDGDGRDELLLVNGDNGDFPSPHRPYHGLRSYRRTPEGGLVESFFFPLPGAYGVRARDFDQDGDLDLALISFFPDFAARPLPAFVLLRNEGGGRFSAFTLPAADAARGRWLVMDAGDLDGDGDDDLLLGSFYRGPTTTPIPAERLKDWETSRLSVMVLRNRAQ